MTGIRVDVLWYSGQLLEAGFLRMPSSITLAAAEVVNKGILLGCKIDRFIALTL